GLAGVGNAGRSMGWEGAYMGDPGGRQLLHSNVHDFPLSSSGGSMGRSTRSCVAGLAKLFAELAIQLAARGPARSTAVTPCGRAHPEVGPEGACERGGRGKAVIERHLEHAAIRRSEQDVRRALEPQALDEPGERLAGDGPKDAVEVKRRERRDGGEGRECQHLAEMRADVIDDAVDARLVLATVGARHRPDCGRAQPGYARV